MLTYCPISYSGVHCGSKIACTGVIADCGISIDQQTCGTNLLVLHPKSRLFGVHYADEMQAGQLDGIGF